MSVPFRELEAIEVGDVAHQSVFVVFVHHFRSQALDVHRIARNEVLNAPLALRRTGIVGTVSGRLTFVAYEWGTTLRTFMHEFHRCAEVRIALFLGYSDDLRNDLTCLLHIYPISEMQVQLPNDVFVMKRSTFHHRSRQQYRFHICDRSDRTGSSHLEGHFVEAGQCPLCLELVGDGPSR